MLEQIAFYAACFVAWGYFRNTSPQQRQRALDVALWLCLLAGVLGFIAEMAMRGGALPISG